MRSDDTTKARVAPLTGTQVGNVCVGVVGHDQAAGVSARRRAGRHDHRPVHGLHAAPAKESRIASRNSKIVMFSAKLDVESALTQADGSAAVLC
jgi:hypothetical protein